MQTFEIFLNRLVKQANFEKFQVISEENRMDNVIRFSIETIQAMQF